MAYESNNIPNLRTIRSSSGNPLQIDLGKSYTGTMTAQMSRDNDSEEYREFTITENRYLNLSAEQTKDIEDDGITYPIAGKWYFDVKLDTGTPEELSTIYRGTIFFRESITGEKTIIIPPQP